MFGVRIAAINNINVCRHVCHTLVCVSASDVRSNCGQSKTHVSSMTEWGGGGIAPSSARPHPLPSRRISIGFHSLRSSWLSNDRNDCNSQTEKERINFLRFGIVERIHFQEKNEQENDEQDKGKIDRKLSKMMCSCRR